MPDTDFTFSAGRIAKGDGTLQLRRRVGLSRDHISAARIGVSAPFHVS